MTKGHGSKARDGKKRGKLLQPKGCSERAGGAAWSNVKGVLDRQLLIDKGASDMLMSFEKEQILDGSDDAHKHYREEGDEMMYTEGNLLLRKAMRLDDTLETEMGKFWHTFESLSTKTNVVNR